jgi:hypothetical protein
VVCVLFSAGYAAPGFALDWSPLISIGFTKGGDSLGTSVETQQNKTTTHHIRAGQFMLLNAGATFALPGLDDWEAQTTVGYWFDSVTENGGELRFRRIPIEVVAIRNFDATWRVSGGLTYHTAVERRCTQDTCTVPTTTFDDALGLVAEIDWLVGGPVMAGRAEGQPATTKLWFGARLTFIEYQAPDSENKTYSANNLGLVLGLNF